MVVHQLPVDVGVFAQYLRELTERLDRDRGWYGVFRQRDPDGLFACLQGAEIPPWDVVESLLHDLAAGRSETARARLLHSAAAVAHDGRPGGRRALQERLELMRREQVYAAGRGQELLQQLTALPEDTPEYRRLADDLSWTNDDHTRATARCAELAARLAALPPDTGTSGSGRARVADAPWHPPSVPAPADGAGRPAPAPAERMDPAAAPQAGPEPALTEGWFRPEADEGVADREPAAGPAARAEDSPPSRRGRAARSGGKRRSRGARYAWADTGVDDAVGVPVLPVGDAGPRGARFGRAGAGAGTGDGSPPSAPARQAEEDAQAERAAVETVATLGRLRAEGHSGEAHAVLCEAALRPAAWLPVLAAELHRAGLGADWATLLWEAASLPPGQLAAAAGALAAAGRTDDCGHLLRQGVARPAAEIADAVLALDEAGGRSESSALLTAFVQVRTAEEAARIAAPDPRRLVPQLLSAARAASRERERDLVHALRVAGFISG
ncbi:UL36 very large tegument protein [Streptomyces sp. NPDC057445]|uniref:UL36 very large tegument protein n=1 Tax=Streptomyces sp. NPDC057445 TaxID=3346136 RepID=UPI0036D14FE2